MKNTAHPTPAPAQTGFDFFATACTRLHGAIGAVVLVAMLLPSAISAQVPDTALARQQVDSLVALSRKRTTEKNFEAALHAIESAEQTALSAFGDQSDPYAKALFNHGRILQNRRELAEAEPFYLKAKHIWAGSEHDDYTGLLNNLGVLYNQLDRLEEGEAVLLELVGIRRKTSHPQYSGSLVNLGSLYLSMGRYEAAERHFSEAAALRSISPGSKSLLYAQALNGWAATLLSAKRYEQAEPIFLEALAIFRDSLGANAREYVANLGNLGQLYSEVGRYERAEQIMTEVISILGETAPEYANNALNLAGVYLKTGRYAEAEALFLKARDSREQHSGKGMEYAQSLDNLASLYTTTKRYGEAEKLYREALSIREASVGKMHPAYAANRSNLGVLLYRQARYDQAETMLSEAYAIKEGLFGSNSPALASNQYNLALLYQSWGRPDKARPLYQLANAAHRTLVTDAVRTASEVGMLAYLAQYQDFFGHVTAFAAAHPGEGFAGLAYDNALLFKDFLLEKKRRLLQGITSADSATHLVFEKWQASMRQLSAAYALGNRDPKIEQEAEQQEKTLARSIAAFAEVKQVPMWQNVRDRLHPTEAAIEFIRYPQYDARGLPTDNNLYAALLLLPDAAAPQFVPLCAERQIEALTPEVSGPLADYYQNLYSPGPASLHALLWAPVEKTLAARGIKTVYYAPVGILHRLNLGALPRGKSGRVLADSLDFVLLGSTREIARADRSVKTSRPASAVVYGGIHYDMDADAIARADRNIGTTAQDTAIGLFRAVLYHGIARNRSSDNFDPLPGTEREARRFDRSSDNFDPLPGTEREARRLFDLLRQLEIPVTLRLHHSATEKSFKQLGNREPAPALLHIGTHGFFFPDPQTSPTLDGPAFKISEHPLIRSGLKLAGSKYAWYNQRPLSDLEDDGILTAHEVSQMNLSGTELVVLSACETGLGDIHGNEGVYGLQRAFRIAGAKNVLMSLWKVDDDKTALLLDKFYDGWLLDGKPIREALRDAQAWMRRAAGFSNPYFWAGFVLVGE